MTSLLPRTAILLAALVAFGCAKQPWQIEPTYVPDATYANLDCQQLFDEIEGIRKVKDGLYEGQITQANIDGFLAGFLGITPTLLGVGNDRESQLAALTGAEIAALNVYNRKKCVNPE